MRIPVTLPKMKITRLTVLLPYLAFKLNVMRELNLMKNTFYKCYYDYIFRLTVKFYIKITLKILPLAQETEFLYEGVAYNGNFVYI